MWDTTECRSTCNQVILQVRSSFFATGTSIRVWCELWMQWPCPSVNITEAQSSLLARILLLCGGNFPPKALARRQTRFCTKTDHILMIGYVGPTSNELIRTGKSKEWHLLMTRLTLFRIDSQDGRRASSYCKIELSFMLFRSLEIMGS